MNDGRRLRFVRDRVANDWIVRVSYSIGLTLCTTLALLRASHAVMPWWLRGTAAHYDRGVYDPALWATFYTYLLVLGAIPALVGLICGIVALRRRAEPWAAVGVVLNGAFVLTAIRLGGELFCQGFVTFLLTTIPRFLEV